ncbi:MAG: accessory Sec system translocase SecA2 [Spirochaetes bacterium]|nr:accessory Sec system translocase SecA2 [Spirochaetota bacterium]
MVIETDLSPYAAVAVAVRGIDLSAESDEDLAGRSRALRGRIASGADPASEIVPVFALVAEACRRRLHLQPYDEQLAAGVAMHRGKVVQVQTGEGKTLAAVFPACLDAMTGKGVHVLTANDYLARRDAEWMRPVYEALGVSVASVGERTDPAARRAAYRADVTYLTAREAGFDHLRDGLACDAAGCVQREPEAAIVDEADFLLVDEARVPLVIAGSTDAEGPDVRQVDLLVRSFLPGREYDLDREGRRVSLRLEAHPLIEQAFGVEGIHEELGAAAFARVHAALHAHALLARDVDYVVKEGRVELVDGFTGRIADRRQWPWGIQAAIEAKEGLAIRPEGRVFGTITIQHLVRQYRKLSAMTATAVRCAGELAGFYGLATVIVPTVEPVRRVDLPDLVFRTRAEKLEALVSEIAAARATGRPVLVGTGSVKESEELASLLAAAGVPCEVLNARNDECEAELVAGAGLFGAVTISTNMAGRGTDIRPDSRSLALGGLYVIGTNRHESRRVDDQLRGRAGRQGEPGSSRFFVSLEDPLFERYGVREFLPKGLFDAGGTGPIPRAGDCTAANPRVGAEIDRAQSIIEEQNHIIRKVLYQYARLVELDRISVRRLRDDALLDGRLPSGLEEACPAPDLRPLVVQVFLCRLDWFWADHLRFVDEVREGIGLEHYAGRDPGLEYLRRVGDAFEVGLAEVERSVAGAYERIQSDPGAASLGRLGFQRPSSTWTYQVDDAPPISFNLALVAGANIGFAAIAAGPLAIVNAVLLVFSLVAKALRRLFRRPDPPARAR